MHIHTRYVYIYIHLFLYVYIHILREGLFVLRCWEFKRRATLSAFCWRSLCIPHDVCNSFRLKSHQAFITHDLQQLYPFWVLYMLCIAMHCYAGVCLACAWRQLVCIKRGMAGVRDMIFSTWEIECSIHTWGEDSRRWWFAVNEQVGDHISHWSPNVVSLPDPACIQASDSDET